jgi:hypothetical protein
MNDPHEVLENNTRSIPELIEAYHVILNRSQAETQIQESKRTLIREASVPDFLAITTLYPDHKVKHLLVKEKNGMLFIGVKNGDTYELRDEIPRETFLKILHYVPKIGGRRAKKTRKLTKKHRQ